MAEQLRIGESCQRWWSDAAALAATYGSVSAVTFITATQHLTQTGVAYGGHMAAAMALMESPAIILAVLLANRARRLEPGAAPATSSPSIGGLLHESLTEGAQVYFTDMDGMRWTYEVSYVENLQPTQIEEMTEKTEESDEWDLTLFTCTTGGSARCAVRCVRTGYPALTTETAE